MTDVKIKCDSCKFVDGCVDYGWRECKKITQKPSELITNEEWFCQLTTEEKARVLVSNKLFFRMLDYDGFVEWLKQLHTSE